MQAETWASVADHPGYEVSDTGRVKGPQGVLKPWPVGKAGHLYISLGRKARMLVHRLVLMAFVGPCPRGLEARHLNDKPQDNRLENLAWGTRKQNAQDRKVNGIDLHGRACPWAKLCDADVLEIKNRRKAGETGVSLAGEFGVSPATICMICRGQRWKHIQAA